MNKYVELYQGQSFLVIGLWGSGNDWNYDYQNVPEIRGTDFLERCLGTGLYFRRYEMAATAIKKIQIEAPSIL